ncbi:hypothetical protein EPUS_06134 [Endocarpon pusillum Z07020]|uniref:Uncharacterized protein n=1 Tax=Endocarpon pusillum (strain Z07020 / HMAS-L-300199) TaxID=1263415 RepID=U1GFP5_ENDPU|nr:uncharacterized protein EPUS_06134 [Endocarpon pusillum Z07020]ERF76472.1 hypothetical protein EPUS_06134 [Endocarpon pusillum Z07020]
MSTYSTAANAFAVVGLADVVFRLGIASSDLYLRCRNASKDVPRLLSDLKTLSEIVAQVRAFASEYSRSPYALEDSQVLLPQLETTLRCCKRELEELERIAKNDKSNANDAWFRQWGKGLGWALDDQKVLKSCQQIERYMVTLNTALSLTGRQNDIVLRRELKAIREDIADAHASTKANYSDLRQNVTVSSHTIEQGVQQVSAAIQSSKQANSASFLTVEKSLASGHAELSGINVAIDDRAKIINQSLSSVKKSLTHGRREQGALVRQHKISTSKLMTRLDDVCSSLTQQITTISLTETEDNEIFFEGENLGAIVLPLLLMQTDLSKAIRNLMTEGSIKISRAEARWVEEEFEKLLVYGHEAAALAARSRRCKVCKRAAHHLGSAPATRTTSSKASSSRSKSRNQNQHHILSSKLQRAHRFQRRHQIHTAAGILVLETSVHDEGARRVGQSSSSLLALRLSFFPKLNLSSVGVTAAFFKQFGTGMEPKIMRLVQTYNTVPTTSEAFICAKENDVMGLQKLFAAGEASPYDCDEYGWSLLSEAAYFGSLEAYMFLLREGTNALMVPVGDSYGGGLLYTIWMNLRHKLEASTSTYNERTYSPCRLKMIIENARRMTAAAVERNCDPNMPTMHEPENIMHCAIRELWRWVSNAGKNAGNLVCHVQLSGLFSDLIAMGCELEGRDPYGRTPLLLACFKKQYGVLKILDSKGADVTALDNHGAGALHLLLAYTKNHEDYEEEQLRDALITALVNGCDPNKLSTDIALSPTDFCSATRVRWDAWTKALSYVGYTLLETAEVEPATSGFTWVVVSTDYHDGLKLPVSNSTLDDWKAERSRIRWGYFSRIYEASDVDDSVSAASEAHEDITEWEDDSGGSAGSMSAASDAHENITEWEDNSNDGDIAPRPDETPEHGELNRVIGAENEEAMY